MPTTVIMPALGVAQQTGTLLKWLKAEGQSVSKGEPLMEIETDKATVEIEAPASGVLSNVTAAPGDEVPVGNRIALILAPGESASAAKLQDPHPRIESGAGASPLPKDEGKNEVRGNAAAGNPPPLPEGEGGGEGRTPQPTPARAASRSSASIARRLLASPAARRIAGEKGVDLAAVEGSGPEGSVLAADVLRATAGGTPAAAEKLSSEQMAPLTPMRRIVGERMALSKQTAPHFYLSMDIDMGAVVRLRRDWGERGDALTPSINDFILLACARALKEFPSVNASYGEQGLKLHPEINIGMAVALDEGLVVPVVRNADGLALAELAAQSRRLVDKAQNRKLFPLDYEGGTFTVSNLGMLGVDSFTAIINPPQCGILAVGRVAPRVVVEEGMFAIRSMMTATLSADHRVIDGATGARFLQEVKKVLESPEA
jgi:pyruvate dehydrogenase E2 component (dihydrolipoamide acetyltransferase)